jgi:probable rRNA maturation factor
VEVGHSLEAEMAHLLVHGILHLLGFDHVNSTEEEALMRAREEHYLGALGHLH